MFLFITVSLCTKKNNELAICNNQGEKGEKRLNSLKWKERKGGKEAEREKERERERESETRRV